MVTAQQTINRALGKLGILGAGQTPSDDDNELCLRALKGTYRRLRTSGAFGKIYDTIPSADRYEPAENEHVARFNSNVEIIDLPETIANFDETTDYGATTYYEDFTTVRPPRDCSYIAISDPASDITEDWIYDGQNKVWRSVERMSFNDPAPLGFRDENGLACLLALAVADDFGVQPSDRIALAARQFEEGITHNWSQAGELTHKRDYF